MPFSIENLDHVVVRVTDFDRAIRFYTEVLGCTVERRNETSSFAQLRACRSLIDLMKTDEAWRKGVGNMHHFALFIDRFDEPELRDHMQRHGIDVGDTVTHRGAAGDYPSVYLQDPDQNCIELMGPADS